MSVVGEDVTEIRRIFRELRVLVGENSRYRDLGVDVSRVHVLQCFFLRESLCLVCVTQMRARKIEQIGGVFLIHYREMAREPAAGPKRRSSRCAVEWKVPP